jgi:hypothetical protein
MIKVSAYRSLLSKIERSPFESWSESQDYFEANQPTAIEAEFLADFPGVELGVGYWYGGCDPNMASIAFRRGSEMSYLDQRYASLEKWILKQPKPWISIAHD